VPVRLQAPLGHPLRFFLARGKRTDRAFVQAGRQRVGLDVGDEAGVVATAQLLQDLGIFGGVAHASSAIWARVTPRRARATTSLMRRQLARTPQDCSIPQLPACRLHSVMPSGPSIASTISARLMSAGLRSRR